MTFSCAMAEGFSEAAGSEASGVAADSEASIATFAGETEGSAVGVSSTDGPEAPGVASRAVAGSEAGVSVEAGSGVVVGFVKGVSVTTGEAVGESASRGVAEGVDWEASVSAATEEGREVSETGVPAAGVLDLGVALRTVLTTRLLGAIGTGGISRFPKGDRAERKGKGGGDTERYSVYCAYGWVHLKGFYCPFNPWRWRPAENRLRTRSNKGCTKPFPHAR